MKSRRFTGGSGVACGAKRRRRGFSGCGAQFRRWRVRYEADGAAGLYDRRLGRGSERRAPVDEVMKVLELFDTRPATARPRAGRKMQALPRSLIVALPLRRPCARLSAAAAASG